MRGRGGEPTEKAAPSRQVSSEQFISQVRERFPLALLAVQETFSDGSQYTEKMVQDRIQDRAIETDYPQKATIILLQAMSQEGELVEGELKVCTRCGSAQSVHPYGDKYCCTDCHVLFGFTGELDTEHGHLIGADRSELGSGGQGWRLKDRQKITERLPLATDQVLAKFWHDRHQSQPQPADAYAYRMTRFGAEAEDAEKIVQQLAQDGLVDEQPMMRCKYCASSRRLNQKFFRPDPEQGVYEESPKMWYCDGCNRMESTEGLYVSSKMKSSDDFLETMGTGFRLSTDGETHMQAIFELQKQMENFDDEESLKNGGLDVDKNERAILARFAKDGEQELWAVTSGSKSRLWDRAREKGWITPEQYDAALKRHSHNWNVAGD